MTNENLQISRSDLLELKYTHPDELEVILEMLAEAGEPYYLDDDENQSQAA